MTQRRLTISSTEFIAIMAIMSATAALSIDGMLPALPDIGRDLSPAAPNKAQFVLGFFIWGLAIGTFVSGPISDAVGRKVTAYVGIALFCTGAALSYLSTNIELMFAARFLQGIGAAAPRIMAQAMIRDFYSGRDMARFTSYVMMIFALVPSFAPMLGAVLMDGFGWRAIFEGFVIFGIINVMWLGPRIPEPLAASDRIELNFRRLFRAVGDVFKPRVVRISLMGLVASYAILFVTLMLVQQAFEQVFAMGDVFVYWFAGASLFVGLSSVLNSRLVMRFGMRRLTIAAIRLLIVATVMIAAAQWTPFARGPVGFALFYLWLATIFTMIGLSIGNLTALAMEPLGHIAGTAASTLNAIATFGGVAYATCVGQFFNATLIPMIFGVLVAVSAAHISVAKLRQLERGATD